VTPSSLRAFVGVRVPPDLAPGYVALQRAIRCPGRIKWVEAENLHLTLRFLGRVERADLPAVVSRLRLAAVGVPPASLRASRVTAFPSERGARVVTVELADAADSIPLLHAAILRELGAVEDEGHPFRMHVTLGRLAEGKADLRASLAALPPPAGSWRAAAFELVESVLGPAGPTYTTLDTFSLGG
jgi:2'-5' RNA ligase